MKKLLIAFTAFLSLSSLALAQDGHDHHKHPMVRCKDGTVHHMHRNVCRRHGGIRHH
jgi:hypothetical protein